MPNYREHNAKLAGLQSMRRVTRTMKMVSATKLKRAQAAEEQANRFLKQLQQVARGFLVAGRVEDPHPLMTPRSPVRNGLLLVFSSDKGLCGGFNSGLARQVQEWVKGHQRRFRRLRVSFAGQKARQALKGVGEFRSMYEGVVAKPVYAAARTIGTDAIGAFLARRYDEVYMAYNAYRGVLSQEPVVERLLPVGADILPQADRTDRLGEYLCEPDPQSLLGLFLVKLTTFTVYHAMLHNAVGEHAARMTAMDNATTNIDHLTVEYTKLRNQARQAAITSELNEIISGAEALR